MGVPNWPVSSSPTTTKTNPHSSGYQFKFVCESCGNGYLSSFRRQQGWHGHRVVAGGGEHVGRVLGHAGSTRETIARRSFRPAHDKALQDAVEEIRPLFVQCKRCGQWVCREVCWNAERGLCTECAPMAQREIGSLQAQITVEQAAEKLRRAT